MKVEKLVSARNFWRSWYIPKFGKSWYMYHLTLSDSNECSVHLSFDMVNWYMYQLFPTVPTFPNIGIPLLSIEQKPVRVFTRWGYMVDLELDNSLSMMPPSHSNHVPSDIIVSKIVWCCFLCCCPLEGEVGLRSGFRGINLYKITIFRH